MATQKKISTFFCPLLFEATLTSFVKDKKSHKKSQTGRSKGFSYNFA
jgi:hypothetical protein